MERLEPAERLDPLSLCRIEIIAFRLTEKAGPHSEEAIRRRNLKESERIRLTELTSHQNEG